jgi:hypothetical protein
MPPIWTNPFEDPEGDPDFDELRDINKNSVAKPNSYRVSGGNWLWQLPLNTRIRHQG